MYLTVGTSLSCFYFYILCYAAVLLKFTYYAYYYIYAQEQKLLSDYYALYVIVHEEFTACSTVSHGDCFIRVYRLFTTIFYKCLILLLILILHSYYAGIVLNAFSDPLSSKLCHNRRIPTLQYAPCIQLLCM